MPAPSPGRFLVLVAEDNPAEALLLQEAFAGVSVHVELQIAGTGGEALQLLRSSIRTPDLILVDGHLPDLEGPELVDRLRAEPAGQRVPIVVLSGDLRRGAGPWQDWIAKPSRWSDWEELARDLLRRFLLAIQP